MGRRKKIPPETETEVLTRSRRRCCLCFGLEQDLEEKLGQIAHLDRDPSNDKFDNLAWMCLKHHALYDSKSHQSKGFSIRETKEYRDSLYDVITAKFETPWLRDTLMPHHAAPLLRISRSVDPIPGVPFGGILLADDDFETGQPWLYFQIHFKESRYFGQLVPADSQKWLYVEANMRPALNLHVQVRAWNTRDIEETLRFLRNGGRGYDLHGPQPSTPRSPEDFLSSETLAGDYLHMWEENGERRLLISTFTATNAGISVHARLTDAVSREIAEYLETVGFAI